MRSSDFIFESDRTLKKLSSLKPSNLALAKNYAPLMQNEAFRGYLINDEGEQIRGSQRNITIKDILIPIKEFNAAPAKD